MVNGVSQRIIYFGLDMHFWETEKQLFVNWKKH